MPVKISKLIRLWKYTRKIPGFLRFLDMLKCLEEEDVEKIDQIEHEALRREWDCKKDYEDQHFKIAKQVQEFKKEIKETYPEEIKEARLQYIKPQISQLSSEIENVYLNYEDLRIPWALRESGLALSGLHRLQSKRKRLLFEQMFLEEGKKFSSKHLSPAEIEYAKRIPFDYFLKFNRANMCKCPFHEDKIPSLHWIRKSNILYCHGCTWKGNPINFLMKQNNISFREAVGTLLKI
ncbi:hypothetical protein KAW50_03545 [candidate division WOR-3 bacterium]|nr:hypothetical protein [candidate division WOR-3 bacterium]